jgi:hypothetical protein
MRPLAGRVYLPWIPPPPPLTDIDSDIAAIHKFILPVGDRGHKLRRSIYELSKLMYSKSSLLGVALVIRSKEGPRFVFHYPSRLANKECRDRPRYGTELDPTTPDTSDDEAYSDGDDLEDDMFRMQHSFGAGKKRHVSPWDGDEHFDVDGVQIVPWEHLDAFRIQDLASILTPARSYHKKCFELTLDPLHFVTYPMHIRDDGQWKKKKKFQKKKSRKQVGIGAEAKAMNGNAEAESSEKQADVPESDEPEGGPSNPKPTNGDERGSENGNDDGGMTMFNMVFILNPGRGDEARREVEDVFGHLAKDINKALRYAQSYSNYVWRESDMILTMKDKAKEKSMYINHWCWAGRLTMNLGRPMKSLWHKILEKCSLAVAIRDIYNAISSENIANVRFASDPPVRLSVQIPKPYYLSVPPDYDEESMPGVWITTASLMTDKDGEDGGNLNKHSALLLLDDEDKITAEIQADGGDLAAPLLEYLKILKPTCSLVAFLFFNLSDNINKWL